jgi:hypothetical protein
MPTSQQNLVCDNSTLANFKSWAQAISTFIGATAGWLQSGDTGQVNWTSIAAVPGSNAYVYEIWEPNDGLTNFYLKVEYGNSAAGANQPTVQISIGTATNGAGVLSGLVMGPYPTNSSNSFGVSSTALYDCRFSGAPGRLSMLLWRSGGNCAQVFAVERSLNSSGTYTGTYVTQWTAGYLNNTQSSLTQQTLHFVNGVAPSPANGLVSSSTGGLPARLFMPNNTGWNASFNNSLGFDTASPYVGYWDTQCTVLGLGNWVNYVEGNVFTASVYGQTRTYIATQSGCLRWSGPGVSSCYLCVRYD